MKNLIGSILGIVILCVLHPAAAAQIYVNGSSGNDLNSGLSWTSAKRTIGAGVAVASGAAPDVFIACGEYRLTEAIVLPWGVNLIGSQVPPEGCVGSGSGLTVTRINGETVSSTGPLFSCGLVIMRSGFGQGRTQITDIEFVNGRCLEYDGDTVLGRGGAVNAIGAGAFVEPRDTLVLTRCDFRDNFVAAAGGAVFTENVIVEIRGTEDRPVVFQGNSSRGGSTGLASLLDPVGGALVVSGGQLTIERANFIENSTLRPSWSDGGQVNGGGIYLSQVSAAEFTDCDFIGNRCLCRPDPFFLNETVGGGGGAVAMNLSGSDADTPVLFTRCDFQENISSGGGAIFFASSAVVLVRCNLVGNTATVRGGAVFAGSSDFYAWNCTFEGNLAGATQLVGSEGGALYIIGPVQPPFVSFSQLVNCLLVHNEVGANASNSGRGGAAFVTQRQFFRIVNSTIARNRAVDAPLDSPPYFDAPCIGDMSDVFTFGVAAGGGLYVGGGTVQSLNSIVSRNVAALGQPSGCAPLLNDLFYAADPSRTELIPIPGAFSAPNLINASPLFLAQAPAGILGAGLGNYRLQADDGARDLGRNEVFDPVSASGGGILDAVDLDGDGVTDEAVPVDLDGNTRFSGFASGFIPANPLCRPVATVDVGCYEYQIVRCATDFNWSGVVTVQDLFDFLAVYFSSDLCADFNGNGEVTIQDFFDFYAVFSVELSCAGG